MKTTEELAIASGMSGHEGLPTDWIAGAHIASIEALETFRRLVLEDAQKNAEPVAWFEESPGGNWFLAYSKNPDAKTEPLFTHPQDCPKCAEMDKHGLVLWPKLENAPEDQASEETLEQCRIIGMSAEREAKHLAEIDRLQLAVSKNADCIREQANLLGLGVERELDLRCHVERQSTLIEQCKEALLLAHATFQQYAAHHAAKPDAEKAKANQALAEQMADGISAIAQWKEKAD